MNDIREFRGEFSWLSNFYPVQIEYEGLTYPSVEHAYQAGKLINIENRKLFFKENSPQLPVLPPVPSDSHS